MINIPNYEAHKKIGFISSLIITVILGIFIVARFNLWHWKMLLGIPVVWAYSNLPDLDHHMGRLRKYAFGAMFAMMAVAIVIAAVTNPWLVLVVLGAAGVGGVMILRSRHRGIFHSYLFILLVSVPMLLIHWFLFVLALVSGSSHIFVDRLVSGVKRKLKSKLGLKDNYYLFGRGEKEVKTEQHVHYHVHNYPTRESEIENYKY